MLFLWGGGGDTWSQSHESRSQVHSCCSAGCQSFPQWRSACGVGSSLGIQLAEDDRDSPRCLWCCGDQKHSGWYLPVSVCPSEWRCPSPDQEISEYSSCDREEREKRHWLWETPLARVWKYSRYLWRVVMSLPDEVGDGLVEGPVVRRELGSVIVAWTEMIYIFARSCRRSRVHVCCSLSKREWKVV